MPVNCTHCTDNDRLLAGPALHILVLIAVVYRALEVANALKVRNVLATVTHTHDDVFWMQSDYMGDGI